MSRTTRRILVNALKPFWEVGALLEKIPETLPSNMAKWLRGGLLAGACSVDILSFALFMRFGFLMWEEFLLIIQLVALAGSLVTVLALTPGLMRASRQAALEAGQWKQACLEGKVPPLQLPSA